MGRRKGESLKPLKLWTMAHTCYSYTHGCFIVVANGMIIGRTHNYHDAIQWAQDYNRLHR